MKNYETLLLFRTDTTEDKFKLVEKSISDFLGKVEGKVESFEKWGKYKLAYPIDNQNYGIYALSRYSLPADKVGEFFQELNMGIRVKFSDFVVRHVNVLLKAGKMNPEYKKPSAIDETESASADRRIVSMSNQSIKVEGNSDEPDYSQSEGEVLDISKLSLDQDQEDNKLDNQ